MKLRIDLTKRLSRLQSDLQSDSKTLRYELDQLVGVAQGFSNPSVHADRIASNAYIESFAVHCRALIYFLFGHLEEITANGKSERFAALRDSDIVAFDFHRGGDRDHTQPTEVMLQAKRQADKHVAHITTDRREANQPGSTKESVWNLSQATSAICSVLSCFLSKAPQGNFDAAELQRMYELIAGWGRWNSAPTVQSLSQSGSSVNSLLALGLQAKTEPRTLSPETGFNMHGKTE